MDPIHKKVLANKTSEIMKRISNPVVLSAHLKTIFSTGDLEEIEAKTSQRGATTGTQAMLSLLEKRGPKAFTLFIHALLDPAISCADLADDLEQEERKLRGEAGALIREVTSAPASPNQWDIKDSAGTFNFEQKKVTLGSLVKDMPFALRTKIERMMNINNQNDHNWRGLAAAMSLSVDEVRQMQEGENGKMAGLFDNMIHTKRTIKDFLVFLKHPAVQRLDVIDEIVEGCGLPKEVSENESSELDETDIVQAEQQTLMNAITTGSPIEERQPFPSLNELRPVLPNIHVPGRITRNSKNLSMAAGEFGYAHLQNQQQGGVPVPVTENLQGPQEQVEPVYHAASNFSFSTTDHSTGSTRIPHPPGATDTFSRQPIPEQAITGREVDVQDSAAVTDVQVNLELKGNLQSDGCLLDPEKYDPVNFLGSGGYSKVFLVIEKRTGKKMACKMCDLGANTSDRQKVVEFMETEVRALTSIKHEHIVEFFFVERIRDTVLLFLEYMEGGTLEDLLMNNGPLEEPLVVKFTRQLLSVVDFLHTNGKKRIVHQDIRGANILLDGAQKNIKLCDFGICTIMEEPRTPPGGLWTENNVASFYWTSPELLARREFSRNTDIWSVGCTVVEMLTAKPLLFLEQLPLQQKMFLIVNHKIEPPTDCTPLAFGFLKRCLCPKEIRASAAELLSDPFLNPEQLEEVHPQGVPPEILARGPRATEAYNRALLEGKGYVRRVPVMIIGQERTGKTSLKKSLKGELFNPNEGSTEGIETDPSYFKVSTDVWRTGKNNKDTEPEPTFSFEHQAAQLIVESLMKKETNTPNAEDYSQSPSNSGTESSKAMESVMTDQSPQDFKPDEKPKAVSAEEPRTEVMEPSLQNSQDHLRVPKPPEEIVTLVQRLLKMNSDEDDIYSVIWDFGGQSVYYDTHPIFLTKKAIYILTCDLSHDPSQKANAPTRKSMSGKKEDTCCSKTNLDCLNFWMSSVYSLVSPNTDRQETLSPETLPPVFLVCTHADKPYRTDVNPGGLASGIYGSLKDKVYGKLLKGLFVVDNTKSGSGDECRGVIKLRGKVLSFAKKLPQMNEAIPLKWLKYEKVLHLLSEEGYMWIRINKARQIAREECGIDDDEQFRTLLNFLHDQRVLIHFNESPELEKMVILSPQWLIDVFKEVITIKSWEDVEEDFEELWRNLEDFGILDEKLLNHSWRHLFVNQENCKSLIAVMERFSLLCEWPSDESTKQYLVPSMLRSPPTSDVLELLASAQIPSLFVRFESRRVPPGLFSRLILLFHKWSQERWMSPIKPLLFNNVALFHIRPHNATSLVLLCHSSSIEVVFCGGAGVALADEGGFSCGVDLNVSRDIHRQMRLFLECMRKEFFWLEHMRYEMCVSCPVCSLQKGSSKCRDHGVRGCDCLHLLSELEMQNLPYCKRPVVCGDRRIFKAMFVPWFSFSDEEEGRISLTQQQDVNGRNEGEQHKAVSAREKSLVLPDGVLKAIRSQSCEAADVMAQMEESVESLQLKPAALADPTVETKQWIRCLAINAKNENRMDIVSHLRSIAPAGTTGPLLAENLDVRCIPFKQRKALTFNLCGGDEWKLLAEKLGMSYDEIRVLDKRTLNPCDVALNLVANSRHLTVGEVYDILVECELAGSADLL